ncbi:MAG: nuclear transport factor 2 family protein [Gammaproteobacteria bacterium]|nr:nuclear transport factor 2 family protein [Gammaproteobacteria bacterium]
MKRMTRWSIAALYLLTISSAFAQTDLRDLAERFVKAEEQAWLEGRFEALEAVEDAYVVYHGYPINSFADHKQFIIESRKTITNPKMSMEYLTGDGNLFAIDYNASVTMNGQPVTTKALMLFRVSNGKIAEVWLGLSTNAPQ